VGSNTVAAWKDHSYFKLIRKIDSFHRRDSFYDFKPFNQFEFSIETGLVKNACLLKESV
jgi:hypothetical protein